MEDKLTIAEIKAKIAEVRTTIEELQENAQTLWKETDDKRTEEIASYFDSELGCVARQLSDLEDTEIGEDDEPLTEEEEEALEEWWDDLSNDDKSSIVGIPAPSRNDARGDEQYEFDEYCTKWWNAKTISQKQETYKELADELPWWETD